MLDKGRQSSPGNHGHSNTPNSCEIPLKHIKADSSGRQCPLIHKHDRPISGSPRCPASDRITIFWLVGQMLLFSLPFETSAIGKTKKILILSRFKSISSQMSPDSTEDGGTEVFLPLLKLKRLFHCLQDGSNCWEGSWGGEIGLGLSPECRGC